MRRATIPALLLVLALTLTGCAAGGKDFRHGTVEGRTYTSEFLGLMCTAPETFRYMSDSEIAEMNSVTTDEKTTLADALHQRLEDGGQVQDMYLITEDGLYRVGISVDKENNKGADVDMDAFIANGIAQAKSAYAAIDGMEDVTSEAQTTQFLGSEYQSILTTATYNGFPTQSLQVCIPVGQYICVVTFTSYVEDHTAEMMGYFSAMTTE